ncbi:MAG: hypothetical protein QM820_62925 [Minicystis sp.]
MLRTRLQPSRLARGRAALGAALAVIGLTGAASAAGPKETQAKKALKQAVEEDYLETRFDDAENRLRAAIQSCGTAGCSPQLRAQLHAALGAVLAGGKKEMEDARDEFVEALQLDPKVEPDPGMTSANVTFAFEQARKKLKGGAATPDSKPADEPRKKGPPKDSNSPKDTDEPKPDDKKDAKAAKDKEPETPPPPARKNWITLAFSPDISIVSGTNVCTKEVRGSEHYVCVRNDANRTAYVGTPAKDNADNINTGVALSTLRILLAYDRLLIDNLTLGARIGFAFNGASGGNASFLPVHAEARLGFFPGKTPFVGSGVRPYLMISGGFAQIDTKVNVQVLEDGRACGAESPSDSSSMCTRPSKDGVIEQRVQTLTVYKQAGLGFGSLTFGVQFAPTAAVALYLAVRGNITFPVVTGVLSPEGGLSLGF